MAADRHEASTGICCYYFFIPHHVDHIKLPVCEAVPYIVTALGLR